MTRQAGILALVMLSAMAVAQAPRQESGQENEGMQSVVDTPPGPRASAVMPAEPGREAGQQLQALHDVAPFTDNADGMCEVVNGILGDFCTMSPGDPGCQALLQQ